VNGTQTKTIKSARQIKSRLYFLYFTEFMGRKSCVHICVLRLQSDGILWMDARWIVKLKFAGQEVAQMFVTGRAAFLSLLFLSGA